MDTKIIKTRVTGVRRMWQNATPLERGWFIALLTMVDLVLLVLIMQVYSTADAGEPTDGRLGPAPTVSPSPVTEVDTTPPGPAPQAPPVQQPAPGQPIIPDESQPQPQPQPQPHDDTGQSPTTDHTPSAPESPNTPPSPEDPDPDPGPDPNPGPPVLPSPPPPPPPGDA